MKATALTLEQVRRNAPSVFANNPFPGVSNRYAFVPTATVVEQMMAEGWAVREAKQSFVRTDDRRGYQKHMLRFARVNDIERVNSLITHQNHNVNRVAPLAEFPEVVLTNSHDGSSTYQMHAGLFRLVCCNGLIVADATFSCLRVRHTGDVNAILGASYQILEDTPRIMGQVNAMRQVSLTAGERRQFALAGAMLRYGFKTPEDCPVNFDRLLEARRYADADHSLWSTLNVVQENLVKGGQRARLGETHVTDAGRIVRPTRTREIKAVDATVKVNKGLWAMAGELLAAKQ